MKNKKPLVVILGPTASGKTNLAIKLAQKFNGEIICADSRTIYKFMDIGTAKTSVEERKIIPHFLLDIVKPDEKFSVAEFQKMASKIIGEIYKRKKTPFLVGGTGLYIEAVTEGFKIPKIVEDKNLRDKLNRQDLIKLLSNLKKLDPEAYQNIDRKNKRRIIRALEVCLKTKHKFSDLKIKSKPEYNVLKIGLKIEPKILEKRINKRVNLMFQKGFIREVKKLYKMGYDFDLPSMSGIGYQEIGNYLKGQISLQEAKEKIKLHTRQFAKRQKTWFKKTKNMNWVSKEKEAEKLIKEFL